MSDSPDLVRQFAALAPTENIFPQVEITTERLLLRAYTEADVEDNVALYDHELARRWSNVPAPYTLEDSRNWCTRITVDIRTSGHGIMWAVTDRFTGRLLGCAGFYRTDWRNKITEITAAGVPSAIGHGYAKEACRAMSRWALLDQRFNRLQIMAAVGNPAPQRVAVACGFVREGILRNAGTNRSVPVNMAIYSLIPDDLETGGIQEVNEGRNAASQAKRSARSTEIPEIAGR
jgi:RimJ/RimL family protein N-acetyltransferase